MKKTLFSAFSVFYLFFCLSVPTAFGDVDKIDDLSHKGGRLGAYHALVIGVDYYKDPKIPELKSASKAAAEMASVLRQYYGFSTEVLINKNATKDAITRAVKGLGHNKNTTEIIFFAGRGETDSSGNGYWYPTDAKAGDPESFVKNETIQGMIRDMRARSVLVISDAAYSDTYFGSSHKLPENISDNYYINLYNKQNRWGLASGNDSSKETGMSKFVSQIVNVLKTNEKPQFSLQELYDSIKNDIKGSSRPARCRSFRNSGDQGGEPIFVLMPNILEKIALTKGEDPKNAKSVLTDKDKLTEGSLLSMTVSVHGADIMLDGKKMGKGPLSKVFLLPGSHQIDVMKDGYEPFRKSIMAKKGADLSIIAELKKIEVKPTKGALTVTAVPATSEIRFLSGNHTYSQGMPLEAGAYKIEVSAPFYDKQEKDVVVKAGENTSVSVSLEPVKVIVHKNLGKFILINPGTFEMGSPAKETNMRNAHEKLHKVTMTKRFYIQEKEMTMGQWSWFVKSASYKTEAESEGGAYVLSDYSWIKDTEYNWGIAGFKQTDNSPVVCVSWNDTQAFIKWLNKQNKPGSGSFRLPTEAEWEYTCRAGTKDRFYMGVCLPREQVNFDGNVKWEQCPVGTVSKGTVEVGHYQPNAWGLYDMHGNAMEWCQDWMGDYQDGEVTDPTGPQTGTAKVIRGGGWASYAYNCRSAKRFSRAPNESYSDLGFRLVIEP